MQGLCREEDDMKNRILAILLVAAMMAAIYTAGPAEAARTTAAYKVLEPIHQDNLTIFPVVARNTQDTSQFLTLDEGMRSGEVVVTESGRLTSMIRHRPGQTAAGGAQVNQLVLVNNSSRPLILLAGEIVTGGKQDRVVGSDRIVPAKSDPIDLAVFCVEPGRWTGATEKFSASAPIMAQPSVRKQAMAERNQEQVWAEVNSSRKAMAAAAAGGLPGNGASAPPSTTSYAGAMDAPVFRAKVERVAAPLERSYEDLMGKLRDRKAVGVVVAINNRLEWFDVFASEALLQKYWPKLVRSYAAESLTNRSSTAKAPSLEEAQNFLETIKGEQEVSRTEEDVYRQTEIKGAGWKAFRLTALLPKTGFDLHLAKMTTVTARSADSETPTNMLMRRRGID
jgi:hypothetical protein